MLVGYHASHEQFKPGYLLKLAQQAEAEGFRAGMCSDHFSPFSVHQGQSGYTWSWLGAALQATSLSFGTVSAPGQRYHPAILAQAVATLSQMFPERLWIALGSGQNINEGITGERWPAKAERNRRLIESAGIIRSLLAGETVTQHGSTCTESARLYTRPDKAPLIMGAAITPATAEWVGRWADGLITISRPAEKMKKVIEAFRRGGGKDKPMYLKVQLSYDRTEEDALQGAWEQWRTVIFPSAVLTELRLPEHLDAAAVFISPEEMRKHVLISSDMEKHKMWLKEYF
ncbi:MAG: TIGR03885 family FMN-dependent LLM class oxidoreductase [Dehalococcoidales bacterium]|nr:TIGR03885 family FMN-dependent LLM class oxidoreductase [Dehalococcoidales bacterium]